ncbi:acyl-CoA dehydrogenase family protein [Nonomuraea sp. 3N208]|uniref:acyl-CoA dehydrogenase family protein n=1 Tax=Nonomuraea sp. 3N208 TaxID=3457421 RepID=UPI003FD5CA40
MTTAAALDRRLSDLSCAGRPFDPARLAELDLREEFPAEAVRELDDLGLHRHYVPSAHGGLLADYPTLLHLLRAVARRDLTVAIAHGKTLLGTTPVWVAGHTEQAAELGARVSAGAAVAWGLTEREHGSDLLAGELTARRTAGGWRLDGEKWLINNATRGELVCVLARTRPPGGARGFSLFLVDKRGLAEETWRPLPKVATHGIRGADISGIRFDGAIVPDVALIGAPGQGLEIVLRALQLTRTTCAALSLGAADHGLRLTAGFVRERLLYGRYLADLPRVRRVLGEAAAMALTVEATAEVAARAVHALPKELGVVSSVIKAFAPTVVQELLDKCGELLGVRAFLADGYADGAFAKLERDHRVVAIFDGSTQVNRHALIGQFPRLAVAYDEARRDRPGLDLATCLDADLPPFDPGALGLLSPTGCSVVQSLPESVRQAKELGDPEVAEAAAQLETVVAGLHRDLAGYVPVPRDVPAAVFPLAERYELAFAGAAALHLWVRDGGRRAADPLWRDGLWVRACLTWVLGRLGAPVPDRGSWDALAARLLDDQAPLSISGDEGSRS